MRLVVATCQVDYAGRLAAHLPMATRLLIVKADGSVLVHSDGGSYKPLNWMSPPCSLAEGTNADGKVEWVVQAKTGDTLRILFEQIVSDASHDLGLDPGLRKDGVEKHLQELLAEHPGSVAEGLSLVQREFPTAIGPVDLLCREVADPAITVELPPHARTDRAGEAREPGRHVAVEIKRRATIDAVEQLTRYLEMLNRDPMLRPVRGILAAQTIVPQARTLAEDRGITCTVIDYDELRGMDSAEARLF
ncbi:MAG: endonuclease NucS [Nocardioidaceae bacterium]